MKKTSLLLLSFLLVAWARAGTPEATDLRDTPEIPGVHETPRPLSRHEIRLSIGAYPQRVEPETDYYWYRESFASSKYYSGPTYTAGIYGLEYYYRCSRRWDIGLHFSWAREYYSLYSNIDGSRLKRHDTDYFSFTPTVRFQWKRGKTVHIYSAVGLGVTLTAESGRKGVEDNPAVQITPIGVSAGRRLFGFAELGFGAHGVFICGIGYRFNAKKHRL